jgi:integrase
MNHSAFYGEARHTWKEGVLRYTTEVLPQSVKPTTAKRYLCSLRQVDHVLAGKYIDEINRKTVAEIARRKGPSNATRRRDLTAVSAVLRACVQWGWRDDNPARDFDRSIIRERRDPITLPPDDHIDAMIDTAPSMMGRIIRVAWKTGMREDEIAGLRRCQVVLEEKAIYLSRTKTGQPRVVPLGDPICREAVGTVSGTPIHIASPYVFWHDNGHRYHNFASNFGQVRRRLNRARRKQGLAAIIFRFHDLRHRFAVDYLKATRSATMRRGDVYRLAEILGHASVKTTEIYLNHVPPLGTETGTEATVQHNETGPR